MKTFTTSEVAKICGVAPRTVSKWFDSGRLKGYRLPGSQDRRIPMEYLRRFLEEHDMSHMIPDDGTAKTVLVSENEVDAAFFLKENPESIWVNNLFDLGVKSREHTIAKVILDTRYISSNHRDLLKNRFGIDKLVLTSSPRHYEECTT